MQLDLSRFSPAERSTLQLRVLYEGAGYRKFRCSHFEEYSLYQQNERFLSDSQVITFTDLDGKLRAIKPDVTLSIAKNAQPAAGECKKYYYTEQICRPSRESHTFSEISQMGLECIGAVGAAEQAEVVRLALESLASLEVPTVLEVSHMGFVQRADRYFKPARPLWHHAGRRPQPVPVRSSAGCPAGTAEPAE